MTTYTGTAVTGTAGVTASTNVSGINALQAACAVSNASALYATASAGGVAVAAYSNTNTAGYAAVQAINTGMGTGLTARATSGDAVIAFSQSGRAVDASTNSSTQSAIVAVNTAASNGTAIGALAAGASNGTALTALCYGTSNCTAVRAESVGAGCYAGDFIGTIRKSGGTFTIDHPIEPENYYLNHSFVESPEMKNIYDGIVQLDEKGSATVDLPRYFESLNRSFRYLLTALDSPAPNLHIARRVANGSFSIEGGAPNSEVCWQVTGIRNDAWALANPVTVEEPKSDADKGRYRHPELYGLSREHGLVSRGLASESGSTTEQSAPDRVLKTRV